MVEIQPYGVLFMSATEFSAIPVDFATEAICTHLGL